MDPLHKASFNRWFATECVRHKGSFATFGVYHRRLVEWCSAHRISRSPSPSEFIDMLEDDGFPVVGGIISGMVLKEDLDAAGRAELK